MPCNISRKLCLIRRGCFPRWILVVECHLKFCTSETIIPWQSPIASYILLVKAHYGLFTDDVRHWGKCTDWIRYSLNPIFVQLDVSLSIKLTSLDLCHRKNWDSYAQALFIVLNDQQSHTLCSTYIVNKNYSYIYLHLRPTLWPSQKDSAETLPQIIQVFSRSFFYFRDSDSKLQYNAKERVDWP